MKTARLILCISVACSKLGMTFAFAIAGSKADIHRKTQRSTAPFTSSCPVESVDPCGPVSYRKVSCCPLRKSHQLVQFTTTTTTTTDPRSPILASQRSREASTRVSIDWLLQIPSWYQHVATAIFMTLTALLFSNYVLTPLTPTTHVSRTQILWRMMIVDALISWTAICGMAVPRILSVTGRNSDSDRHRRASSFREIIIPSTLNFIASTVVTTAVTLLVQSSSSASLPISNNNLANPTAALLPGSKVHSLITLMMAHSQKIWRPLLAIVLYDMLSYPIHFLAHSSSINKFPWMRPLQRWHENHHKMDSELLAPAAFYAHPMDFFLQNLFGFGVSIGIAFMGAPALLATFVPVFAVVAGTAHSGLGFLVNPNPLIKHHTSHHEVPEKNFGLMPLTDRLFGTLLIQ